jgi:hypothetical protein
MLNELGDGEPSVRTGDFVNGVSGRTQGSNDHPHGRYGWYIETDDCEDDHTIYVGEYISVTSDGYLLVWSRDHQPLYEFPVGSWRFAFPQFAIEQWQEKGERTELAARPLPAVVAEPLVKPETVRNSSLHHAPMVARSTDVS